MSEDMEMMFETDVLGELPEECIKAASTLAKYAKENGDFFTVAIPHDEDQNDPNSNRFVLLVERIPQMWEAEADDPKVVN